MSNEQNEQKNPLSSWISSICVLLFLGMIGWWGHANHWQFHHVSHAEDGVTGKNSGGSSSQALPEMTIENGAGSDGPILLPKIGFSSLQGARDCGIETAPAEHREMDEVVIANGVVDYDQTRIAQLSLRVSGAVWRVEKHLGEYVERGSPLVIVDSAAVGEAKANLLEACVVYRLKTQHLERVSKIKEAVAGREVIELEAATELARTQRSNALQKLINMGFTIRLDEIESLSAEEISTHLHRLGLPESLAGETTSDNLIPLLAPFSGVVTQCDVVRGEVVEPSTPIYVIADTSKMWIQLNIRQDDANRIKLGTPVIFEGDMRTKPVTAVLTWIGTEIDPRTRTIQARAEVENPLLDETTDHHSAARVLAAGAFGSAKILIQSQPNVVAVPDSALHWQWEIGKEVVFVAEDEGRTFRPQTVSKGLMRNGYVQILEGLAANTPVVIEGGRILAAELSEHLLGKVDDGADAVRTFHHAHDDHQPSNRP